MRKLSQYILPAALLMPAVVSAAELTNPLGSVNNITDLIVVISKSLLGLVAVGATFMLIYGGILMLTSGGNADRVKMAKETLKWTTFGLVLLFLAGAIVRFVYEAFGRQPEQDISASIGLGQAGLKQTTVSVLRFVLGLLGIVGAAMTIYGGYAWLTAGGNEQRIEKAQTILRSAVIGLVIIFFAWAIVSFVARVGANVTTP